ncbi:hypothetical protein BJY01DRAFT_169005 [Aspergillus pseudoustus]|uniref:Uncharacterized protein n=1 Tax=Aspergillus pseudoustus TaxID=1810923 RepID=A0ABR4K3R9_9EURO
MATKKSQIPSTERKLATGAATVMPLTESNLAIHNRRVQPQEHTHQTIREWAEIAKPVHLSHCQKSPSDLSWLDWLEDRHNSPGDDISQGHGEGRDDTKPLAVTNTFRYETTSLVRPGAPNPDHIGHSRGRAVWAKGLNVEGERHGISDNHEAANTRDVSSTGLAMI